MKTPDLKVEPIHNVLLQNSLLVSIVSSYTIIKKNVVKYCKYGKLKQQNIFILHISSTILTLYFTYLSYIE